ncbi:MAG: HAD family hydrolase [Candidatus Fimadaptatus sp.]|jgi:FMN phosphatase YigB (HAD superfamily)
MIRALFCDFYGTLVRDDAPLVSATSAEVARSAGVDAQRFEHAWRRAMSEACRRAHGDAFALQRDIERYTLEQTARSMGAQVDVDALCAPIFDYWSNPALREGARELLRDSPVPVYIVSNIDRADVLPALAANGLSPAGVFTSEDACAYKPRPELFELALRSVGLAPCDVLHMGDSLTSDIAGARGAGIEPLWIGSAGVDMPGIRRAEDLFEALSILRTLT